MEAAAGIEPAHRGFADLRLTTWLRRRARMKGVINDARHAVGGSLKFAVGLEIDLAADPQNIHAIGVIAVLVFQDRLGRPAGW